MGEFTQAAYDALASEALHSDTPGDEVLYSKRHFVLRGKDNWPFVAEKGDTVHLSLYEHMIDRFAEIDVVVDYMEIRSYEQKVLQGYTMLDGVRYRATINLFRRHLDYTDATLVPHA